MPYFVYLVECADKTYYCGITTNISDRLNEHNNSKNGAKYTRGRRPVKLVYSEVSQTKSDALKREMAIKNMSRRTKEYLIHKYLS